MGVWWVAGWATAAEPCAAPDRALLSCDTSANGKVLTVCGSAGRLQYRFGPPGAPELVFPADASPAAFRVEDRTFVRAQATVLSFDNGGFHYEVTASSGGGGLEDAEMNNFQGVYVFQPAGHLVAKVSCAGELGGDWAAVRALLPR